MKDWFDKLTAGVAYFMSALGMTLSKLTFEQWYFVLSLFIGVIALCLNYWNKKVMQKIAAKKGVKFNDI